MQTIESINNALTSVREGDYNASSRLNSDMVFSKPPCYRAGYHLPSAVTADLRGQINAKMEKKSLSCACVFVCVCVYRMQRTCKILLSNCLWLVTLMISIVPSIDIQYGVLNRH